MASIINAKSLISSPIDAITFNYISDNYIENGKLSEQVQIIDCRPSSQYNGWPEKNSTIEGHFPGAYNIDNQWVKKLDDKQFEQLIVDQGLDKNKATFLYAGNDPIKPCAELSYVLKNLGFNNLAIISQPLSQSQQKLVTLSHFKQLVPAHWINALINNETPAYSPKNSYVIVEVQWGEAIQYFDSHIPGALNLDTNKIEEKPWWNRVNDKKIADILSELGICYDTTVILYGRDNIVASRVASIMMYAGVEDVRLLDGGWQAWQNAGFATESFNNCNSKRVSFVKQIPVNPAYIIDIPEVKALLAKDPNKYSLVSIRTKDEHIGQKSGYSYIKEKGDIVGCKWGHSGIDSNDISDFLNPDGTMKSEQLITAMWKGANISADQQVAFYCGTGWRASQVFFFTYVMGWKNISVFDGGWYEWSADKSNPTFNLSED
ncbi:sulfurtransferase [Psychromonas sp. KJ10-10]|uniref:sulfurtransferase n=1 Tax=Psychromonas sp. KJ10-10 TaxID=3391823 RepID=UPI0039B638E9